MTALACCLMVQGTASNMGKSLVVQEALLGTLAWRSGTAFRPCAVPADLYKAIASWFRASVDTGRLLKACQLE
jgi:hypothetical protein